VPSLVLSILLKIFSSMVWLPIKSFLPESILPLQKNLLLETSNKISVQNSIPTGIGKENLERRLSAIYKKIMYCSMINLMISLQLVSTTI
jgi:hypothetical protein